MAEHKRNSNEPKFATAHLNDIVETTLGDGSQGIELEIGVDGNDEDAVKGLINRMGESVVAMGGKIRVEDNNGKKKGSKSFVNNWGSGSAWKHAENN